MDIIDVYAPEQGEDDHGIVHAVVNGTTHAIDPDTARELGERFIAAADAASGNGAAPSSTVYLTGPDRETAITGLWWDDDKDAERHARENGEIVLSATAVLDQSTIETVYDPDDESCQACQTAGRPYDPDRHDSQNCWADYKGLGGGDDA